MLLHAMLGRAHRSMTFRRGPHGITTSGTTGRSNATQRTGDIAAGRLSADALARKLRGHRAAAGPPGGLLAAALLASATTRPASRPAHRHRHPGLHPRHRHGQPARRGAQILDANAWAACARACPEILCEGACVRHKDATEPVISARCNATPPTGCSRPTRRCSSARPRAVATWPWFGRGRRACPAPMFWRAPGTA